MASMWLVFCPPSKMELVRSEIRACDPSARFVRVGDKEGAVQAADGFADGLAGAALYASDAGALLEPVVSHLTRECDIETVLVIVEQLDPGCIARLFAAGATEVIAAGDSEFQRGSDACTGEGPLPASATESPADDSVIASCGETSGERPISVPVPAILPTPQHAGPIDTKGTVGEASSSVASASREMPPTARAQGAHAAGAAPLGSGTDPDDITMQFGRPACNGAAAAVSDSARASMDTVPEDDVPLAPVVVAISGRGGCGKTTVLAAMAWWAARMGMRAAVVDLDLMFGDLYRLVGIEQPADLARLASDETDALDAFEEAVEVSAMRIAPGLTLWGPCGLPEHAELLAAPVERLVSVLRREADVVFADTSVFWGDAVASTVSRCDRCLIVGSGGPFADVSSARAVALAARIGVPKTRMTGLFNRFGAMGCDEEHAMRFEMAVALRSHARIADGGPSVSELVAFGRLGDVMDDSGAFARDIRSFTEGLLRELGCPLEAWDERQRAMGGRNQGGSRIRLPWKHGEVRAQ